MQNINAVVQWSLPTIITTHPISLAVETRQLMPLWSDVYVMFASDSFGCSCYPVWVLQSLY